MSTDSLAVIQTEVGEQSEPPDDLRDWLRQLNAGVVAPWQLAEWSQVLCEALGHEPHCLVARQDGRLVGYLPLALVSSRLFGRFLVSLPYLNSGGPVADDDVVAQQLIDRAVALADTLDVRHLELRNERKVEHPALTGEVTSKVHMRLPLPSGSDELWRSLKAKVRNQVRKGEEPGFDIRWGASDLVDDFYRVFSRNMRDLGTPVYSRRLFQSILNRLVESAELCLLYHQRKPVAAAMLVHGQGITEVPSASSLREYNSANANMLMYWQLLMRAIERGQRVFDFGRSTIDSGTYRFKKQWGAVPHPATWQYYLRGGKVADMRPDNPRYHRVIRIWQRLPVWLTQLIGPPIVRGIP